jgi:dsRNA-specific ribonuclease
MFLIVQHLYHKLPELSETDIIELLNSRTSTDTIMYAAYVTDLSKCLLYSKEVKESAELMSNSLAAVVDLCIGAVAIDNNFNLSGLLNSRFFKQIMKD